VQLTAVSVWALAYAYGLYFDPGPRAALLPQRQAAAQPPFWGIYQDGNHTDDQSRINSTGQHFSFFGVYVNGCSWGRQFQHGGGGRNCGVDQSVIPFINTYGVHAGGFISYLNIAVQMAAPGEDPATAFNAITAGSHDADFNYLFSHVAGTGLRRFSIRPGWEMNDIPGWDWHADGAQLQFAAAFRHIYTLAHNFASANGVTIDVIFNPGTTNADPAPMYPGANYVDMLGVDWGGPYPGVVINGAPWDLNILCQWITRDSTIKHPIYAAAPEGETAVKDYVSIYKGILDTFTNYPACKVGMWEFYDSTEVNPNFYWQDGNGAQNAVINFINQSGRGRDRPP